MQVTGEKRRTSRSSRANQERERGSPSLKKEDLPQPLAYPFANQLEAWRESARIRSGAKPKTNATRHRNNTVSRGDPVAYVGGSGGKRDLHSNQGNTDKGSYTSPPAEQLLPKVRAWNSGSLLVRAGSESRSAGRLPRMTYVYLVVNARKEDQIEVEVIVGADKARTVLSKASGVTCARVPAREAYTVRNLSGDGKTAVLFWTSPSGGGGDKHHGDSIQQDADEQTRQTDKKDGKEEVKHETPEPLERLPTATRNAFSAPIEGVVTGDEEYGME